MALQAQREGYGPLEQTRIGRTMRAVAGLTAVYAHGGMLVNERAALIDVALQARLFVPSGLIHHTRPGRHIPGRCERSMRIVAVRALHESLIDAMFERHRKLRPHGRVAAITDFALLLFRKQELRRGRAVNRMAVGTDDVALGMLATADISAGNGLAVAPQAGIQDFFGSKPRKCDGNRGLAASSIHMVLAGPMAALAAGVFGLLFARSNALIVGISEKWREYV